MPTAPGSWCLQIGAVGAQIMTWINIIVRFSVAAKCLSTFQRSGSQTLTKMFLLILKQSAEPETIDLKSCGESTILKAAPGMCVQALA